MTKLIGITSITFCFLKVLVIDGEGGLGAPVRIRTSLSEKIWASRGILQGDPLSPFLFTIIADSFSRSINLCKAEDFFERS